MLSSILPFLRVTPGAFYMCSHTFYSDSESLLNYSLYVVNRSKYVMVTIEIINICYYPFKICSKSLLDQFYLIFSFYISSELLLWAHICVLINCPLTSSHSVIILHELLFVLHGLWVTLELFITWSLSFQICFKYL